MLGKPVVWKHNNLMLKLYTTDLTHPLAHLPLDKMSAILSDNIFKCIFFNENFYILIRISLKFVPKGPITNKWALVQVMVWRRNCDKPLPEPMPIQFTGAYMRH